MSSIARHKEKVRHISLLVLDLSSSLATQMRQGLMPLFFYLSVLELGKFNIDESKNPHQNDSLIFFVLPQLYDLCHVIGHFPL